MKHPPISKRIERIYKQFYTDVGRAKFTSIVEEARRFVDGPEQELQSDRVFYGVDNLRVKSVVESYFFDVIKYKEYHFNPKDIDAAGDPLSQDFLKKIHERNDDPRKDKVISEAKVAAFTIKWLSRYSPIYVTPLIKENELTSREKSIILRMNALFAIDHGFSLMGLRMDALPEGVPADLLYHLLYRTVDDRSLILSLSFLHQNWCATNPA